MWWRKPLFALLLPLALSACGFHPLYGKQGVDPNVADELASIQVDPLRDRQGQLIHNALIKALTPEGTPGQPRYHLYVTYVITEAQQALRTDDTATRDVLYYRVLYRLYEGSTAITAGTFPKTFSYDFLTEHFANVAAQSDIQNRAAEAICEEVRNRLAIYFTNAAKQKTTAAAQ
jgi:LPS-assembly lipoprotein